MEEYGLWCICVSAKSDSTLQTSSMASSHVSGSFHLCETTRQPWCWLTDCCHIVLSEHSQRLRPWIESTAICIMARKAVQETIITCQDWDPGKLVEDQSPHSRSRLCSGFTATEFMVVSNEFLQDWSFAAICCAAKCGGSPSIAYATLQPCVLLFSQKHSTPLPSLRHEGHDPNDMCNYWPLSDLTFPYKIRTNL